MTRRGFTLTELLLVGGVITVLGAFALPYAYAERLALNEQQAQGYLRMVRGAQEAWRREVGDYQQIGYIAVQPPISREQRGPGLRTPLLPHGLLPFGEDDIGHRGGYRFENGMAPGGSIRGCWAWPETPGYSGKRTFWVEYDAGALFEVLDPPDWAGYPALPAPAPDSLVPITD